MGEDKLNKTSAYLLYSKEEKIKNGIEQDEIVSLVDNILCKAIEVGASDIHLETTENNLRVRYRIDGVLYNQESIDLDSAPIIISRLKVLSSLDIAEKRIPQDGKIRVQVANNIIDLRISTFPSTYGEKVVVRILDKSQNFIELESLGFNPIVVEEIVNIIERPNGFFLVTGPTGSGKTTTLYAVLSKINNPQRNIITMEDPVEYDVEGITQSQVNLKAGFSFENGLRSILRQDPDIIMVGEIRDKQTCRIAIESALTGHLVLSTLHTNDSAGAITRLLDMGLESFLINASLSAVLAQRLVRKLCDACKEKVVLSSEEQQQLKKKHIDLESFFKSKGCKKCFNLGYKGRIGIFELLIIDDDIRNLIKSKQSTGLIYKKALENGMITLFQDGLSKVKEGQVSLEEFLRVISD